MLAAQRGRGLAVEGDRAEVAEPPDEFGQRIVPGIADRLVETAAAPRRSDHVPQPDAALREPPEPSIIFEPLQILANRPAEQAPELVGGVSVIAPVRERDVARQAAEDDQPRVIARDWAKTSFELRHLSLPALAFAFDRAPATRRPVAPEDLRIALFSGNYNYVRDGANQALNRLVGFLLRQGAKVRVYAPVVDNPAFPPTGDLVGLSSVSIPRRREYRIPTGIGAAARRDLEEFAPNIVHISSPDFAAHRAVTWARRRNIATVASVHTRFETYLSYYHLEFLEPALRAMLRRLYRRCDAILAPAESTAAVLRAQHMSRNIHIWTRGVDREQFNPGRRDMDWRRSIGIKDDELAVVFLGRLVLEKGLDDFAGALDELRERGIPHRALVIGEGPARAWFEKRTPDGVFLGHLVGDDLARALASGDVFLNPSVTEAFGNVTLEVDGLRGAGDRRGGDRDDQHDRGG